MADHLETRRLGRTELRLTALGLGTAGIGELFEPVDEPTAAGVLAAAWERGCRYFDTAPFYGHGQAEIRTGRGLYRRPRDELVLSTKVGRLFSRPADPRRYEPKGWVGGLPFALHHDYTHDGIMRSVEDSYLRLGMSRIDILLIHDLDRGYHADPKVLAAHRRDLLDGGWRALESLKSAGVIGAVGAGSNDRETLRWFLDALPVDLFLLALRYTLLDNDVLDDELPRCAARGIGLVVGGAFNSGVLASGAVPGAKYDYADAPAAVLDKVARIERVCRAHDVPLAAAALQFPAAHPSVASVIPGALTPAHVRSNVAAFDRPIPPRLWADLKSEKLLRADAPVPG